MEILFKPFGFTQPFEKQHKCNCCVVQSKGKSEALATFSTNISEIINFIKELIILLMMLIKLKLLMPYIM